MPRLGFEPELVIKVARERALSDHPMQALQMLGEVFEGMDIRQASDILAGRSTLRPDGEGSYDLVPSDPGEALSCARELDQRYGSRVRIGLKWYEAYVVVTRMGGQDEAAWYGIPQSQREMAYRAWRGEAPPPRAATSTFSRTVRLRKERLCWNVLARPRRPRRAGLHRVISVPSRTTWPSSG